MTTLFLNVGVKEIILLLVLIIPFYAVYKYGYYKGRDSTRKD